MPSSIPAVNTSATAVNLPPLRTVAAMLRASIRAEALNCPWSGLETSRL
ncbi:hypothetical protein [Enterocloster clostridioformis]|nr:hypothetical protein [Enterocloster clostridioformis]MDY4764593.1 hypothetical protein [Enterocloster clostridioformis]NSJ41156.1 hypothetical protein [Enterocloster clostridioformis]